MLIKNISNCIEKEIFKEISNYCDNNELESYVIGGYVRDHLIGKLVLKISIFLLLETVSKQQKVLQKNLK